MADRTRVAINITERSIEVEGNEEFVRSYTERLDAMLSQLLAGPPALDPAPAIDAPITSTTEPNFGAFMQHMPKDATDVDKMLAAGYWLQSNSADQSFATADAGKKLTDFGYKIGNPSQSVKQSITAKNSFMLRRGRYRVSQQGADRLRTLMGDGQT